VPSGLATLAAVIVLPLAAVAVVRIVGGLVLRRWPKQHAAYQRHWLWSTVPVTAIYLAVIRAWWFAILWVAVSVLVVMLLKRADYFGSGNADWTRKPHKPGV
jgi:hypothetical protein